MKAGRLPSLTTRTALTVLAAFVAVFAVLAATISYESLSGDTGEVDRSLLTSARHFATLMDELDSDAAAQLTVRLVDLQARTEATAQMPATRLLVERLNGGYSAASGTPLPLRLKDLPEGVSTQRVGDDEWRVYVASGRHWRAALVDDGAARTRTVFTDLASDLAVYLAIALPVVLVPVWLSVRSGLKPLRRLSEVVAARRPEDRSPLPQAASYRELRPLEQALNRQFAQAAESIQREKAFVHDAAHELRTPLAVIAAQAHVLAESDGPSRAQARRQLEAAVIRASHLAHQLLKLAQADATSRGSRQPVDLMNLARDALALVATRAADQGTELSLQGPDHAPLQSDSQALRSILDNLLDNALRYGGPGGTVDVSVQVLEHGLQLQVADSGPGIAPDQRERVFERFWRGAAVDQPGTGLGLAIVREAARGLGGDAQVADRPGQRGCAVVVRLP